MEEHKGTFDVGFYIDGHDNTFHSPHRITGTLKIDEKWAKFYDDNGEIIGHYNLDKIWLSEHKDYSKMDKC